MVELEEVPSDPLKMGSACKRSLEIDDGISQDLPFGCSRQKVSASRDFQPVCGQHELEISGKSSNVGLLLSLGCSVGSELPKLPRSPDPLKPETAKLLEGLNQANFLEALNDSETQAKISELMGMPSSLNKVEPANSQEANVQMLDVSDLVEATEESVPKRYPPPRRVSSDRDFSPGCGRDVALEPKEQCQEGGNCALVVMDETVNANKNAIGQSEGIVTEKTGGEGEYSSDKMIVPSNIDDKEKEEEEPMVDCVHSSFSEKNMNHKSFMRNTDSSEGNISIRRSARLRKKASQHKNKTGVKDEVDSLPYEDGEKEVPVCQELSMTLIPYGSNPSNKRDDSRRKVRETLRLFQATCRKLLREEEANPNQKLQAHGRIDLTALNLLRKHNKCLNTGKAIIGSVPGVEVGDEFHFRVELAIVGLHRPFQSGIDYMKKKEVNLAVSVVASGGYADDVDSSDVLIYSGQGGKPSGGDKKAEDQKLERGNLALKNSLFAKTPVRVVYGFKEPFIGSDSKVVKGKVASTYTYGGLYLVEKYWQETGVHGCYVFKFQMRRVAGQPELAIKEIKKSKKLAVREGLCMDDVSQGKEKIPIGVVNTIDNEQPPPFEYITTMIYPPWYKPTNPRGCDCTNGCSDAKKCVCVEKNGGEIPFNHNGAIVEAKRLVYECGPSCKCPPSCHNRVSQHGISLQLEVFKTESRGWGVRSLASIPSGSFICEYTGELIDDKEAEQRFDEYLFDIGKDYNEPPLGDSLSSLVPIESQSSALEKVREDGGYTIDAAEHGNVGRFINHSCSPNLYAQNVLYDHDDDGKPHIMLFAAENIPPLQELTYHYNYKIGQVRDSSGNVKQKSCYCGSNDCTGRLY